MKKLYKILAVGLLALVCCGCEICGDTEEKYEKWPGGIIPYTFLTDFSEYEKNMVYESMKKWEASTDNISFEEIKDLKNFNFILKISKHDETYSSSTVGKNFNSYIKISKHIFETFDYTDEKIQARIKHEIGHVLGLLHEHCRPDRDEYIIILWDNIEKKHLHNFEKESSNLYYYKDYVYDFDSIMHYDTWAGGTKTVIIRKDYNTPIFFAKNPSKIDIEKVNFIYSN